MTVKNNISNNILILHDWYSLSKSECFSVHIQILQICWCFHAFTEPPIHSTLIMQIREFYILHNTPYFVIFQAIKYSFKIFKKCSKYIDYISHKSSLLHWFPFSSPFSYRWTIAFNEHIWWFLKFIVINLI